MQRTIFAMTLTTGITARYKNGDDVGNAMEFLGTDLSARLAWEIVDSWRPYLEVSVWSVSAKREHVELVPRKSCPPVATSGKVWLG